jgi:penicillin-binding protein 1C
MVGPGLFAMLEIGTGKKIRRLFLCIADAIMLCIAGLLALPGTQTLDTAPFSLVVEAADGTLLGARIASDGQWRFPSSTTVPEKFEKAIVAWEDHRFWSHPGVDPLALARAAWQDLRAGAVISGGSTITMQVIRLSRPRSSRSALEKLIESILAVRLEILTSKRTILAMYSTHAPFGGNVVGLEAASWRYYNRPPAKLSWSEAATLAVLPNEPSLVHPGRNRKSLGEKRDFLLRKLQARGTIDSIDLRLALGEPLTPAANPLPNWAPHLVDRLSKGYASSTGKVKSSALTAPRVRTTIDANMQARVTAIVNSQVALLRRKGICNAGAIVVSVDSNAVLAYVGNSTTSDRDSVYSNQVDCILAPRSTGSVLKPFLYAAMLDAGELLPTTLVPDIPTSVGGFMPQNFNRGYEGAVRASEALARSLNIPAVHMLRHYSVGRFYYVLKSLGMSTLARTPGDYGISLILGGAEGTLWELTGMYASMARCVNAFASQSAYTPEILQMPSFVSTNERPRQEPSKRFPYTAAACWCAFNAMEEVSRPGEESAWKEFSTSRRVAWKTGTSFGFRDGWAIGVTPTYVVSVWVGNASGEGRPGLIGIEAAAPVLFDIFNALPQTGWFSTPEAQLRRIAVCRASGYQPGPHCEDVDTISAPLAGENSPTCPYHQLIHLDHTGQWRVTDACEPVDAMQHRSWFVLPPVIEKYYRVEHAEYHVLPQVRAGCTNGQSDNPIGIVYPHPNSAVFVPREITGTFGRVVFEAALRTAQGVLFWHLDDEYLGSTTVVHKMEAYPQPGKHRLVLVDDAGNRAERLFEVIGKN